MTKEEAQKVELFDWLYCAHDGKRHQVCEIIDPESMPGAHPLFRMGDGDIITYKLLQREYRENLIDDLSDEDGIDGPFEKRMGKV